MNRGEVRIIVRFSAAVPWWHLAVYGLLLFVGAFSVGRYSRGFSRESSQASVAETVTRVVPETPPQTAKASGVVQVTIRGMEYLPQKLEIKAGETVEWKNDDITPHTVTSASFDSGSIAPDESWRHTFTEADELAYACTFHPDMKGVVSVR
ncbi:MAG: cupredoxin family copper-binding protein [Chthoniobacterales bacterium]